MNEVTSMSQGRDEAWDWFTSEEGVGPNYEYADRTSFDWGWDKALEWSASFRQYYRCQQQVAT